jgi:signal transduction histidine kinase
LFIAAFGAPLILMLNNLISKEYYFNSFLTWWLGDYLGVIILLPFAIILQEYMDKRILEKKIFNVLLPTVTLILAISGIFNFASSQLHDQFEETVLWLIYLFSIAFSILFEIFLFFIFLRDRRLNEVLKSQEDKLNLLHQSMFQSEKIKSMGEMAAEISHEIFNPLTIILGRTEVVLRKIKDENMKSDIFGEYAQIVEKNSQRILAIIKGLLALSRDSRDEKFNMLSIKDILEETLDLCSEKIRTSGIQIQSETPKSDIIIESKHYQLCQVFINLLSNAIDAIKNNEVKWIKIDIYLSKDAKNVNITFTDSGLGIQPHILEKLMTPFFTTKPLGQGTGLGLSISKDIIQQHKGKLYYNKESVNTQFVIELPVAQQQPNLVHSA